jgi:cyclophilin family peptidyl-prolyl cis-trans isomerase
MNADASRLPRCRPVGEVLFKPADRRPSKETGMGFFDSFSRSRTRTAAFDQIETLEPRLALYQNPMIQGLPALASLENLYASVVRFDTNVGKIDVELYDNVAPNTVNLFLNSIKNGRIDESFFHSLTPGLLYGGRGKFSDTTGFSYIPLNNPIPNGLSRSNTAGTLTMMPASSTTVRNDFAFNLVNNPILDTLNGGATVIGKVVQGMNILQTIAGYATQDLNANFGTPGGAFFKVPVTPAYNSGTGPTEATIVRITDIEIIKAFGSNKFYEQSYVYSDGLRNANTIERVDLVNIDSNLHNSYQIIIRYETGDRDSVIASGLLAPGARLSFKVNDANSPGYNVVRGNTAYSFEVRSNRAMGVALNRREQSTSVSEEFLIEARLTENQLKAWHLPNVEKSATAQGRITFENLTNVKGDVYMLLFPEGGGSSIFLSRTLNAYRRTTVNLNALGGVPNGRYSVQISSTIPVAAAASQYTISGGTLTDGSTSMGVTNGGGVEGALAAAMIPTGGTAHLDVMYSAGTPTAIFVDFEFKLNNGSTIFSAVLLTAANRRQTVDLSTVPGLPTNEYFSVRYTERNSVTPVSVSYRARVGGDEMSTPFQTMATRTMVFADGYTDPTLTANQQDEIISIFNPYARAQVSFFYQMVYHFSDGSMVFAPFSAPGGLGALERVDLKTRDFPEVMTKISSNPAFRFYSIEVISVQFVIPLINGGVVTQLTRLHNTWSQNLTTTGGLDPRQVVLFMNHPEFNL